MRECKYIKQIIKHKIQPNYFSKVRKVLLFEHHYYNTWFIYFFKVLNEKLLKSLIHFEFLTESVFKRIAKCYIPSTI